MKRIFFEFQYTKYDFGAEKDKCIRFCACAYSVRRFMFLKNPTTNQNASFCRTGENVCGIISTTESAIVGRNSKNRHDEFD